MIINAIEMKSCDGHEEIREKASKDDNDATEKSFRTHRTCRRCVQVPENNYQRSMEAKVIFITNESLREFTIVLPKHRKLQRHVAHRIEIIVK